MRGKYLNLQVPVVEIHDPLLHLLLVRQQPVYPQEVPVRHIIIVTNLRCGLKKAKNIVPLISINLFTLKMSG